MIKFSSTYAIFALSLMLLIIGCKRDAPLSKIPEVKSLFTKQVFSDPHSLIGPNGYDDYIALISATECEIKQGSLIVLGEYSHEGDKLRIVQKTTGANLVRYFAVTKMGLEETTKGLSGVDTRNSDRESGEQFLSREGLSRLNRVKSISNAKQIIIILKLYSSDHNGKYPKKFDDLIDLVNNGVVIDRNIFRCPLLGDDTQIGYDYFGANMTDSDNGTRVLLMSKAIVDGKRVIGCNDGSVAFMAPPAK